jgi:hypothetical protein
MDETGRSKGLVIDAFAMAYSGGNNNEFGKIQQQQITGVGFCGCSTERTWQQSARPHGQRTDVKAAMAI